MSEVKVAKDALVASLFELSRAAQDAATATVNFYKATSQETSNGDLLTNLATTLNNIASHTSASVPQMVSKANGEVPSVPAAVAKPASAAAASPTDGNPEEKKKKKKVERDPNAPKKPLTIYFAYSFYTRDQIRQERLKQGLSPLTAAEMNEIIKERWNSITPEEKSKWQKKYQTELKDYNVLRDAYKAGKPVVGKVESKPIEEIEAPSTSETPKKVKSESKKRKSESKKLEDSEKSDKGDKESKKSKKSKKVVSKD